MFQDLITVLEQSPVLYLIYLFLIGLAVGSFLNVVIYRLPVMMEREWLGDCVGFLQQLAVECKWPPDRVKLLDQLAAEEQDQDRFNLLTPRSRCGNCGHQITPWENIPVFSYLWLRGKCSACKTRLSPQYPLVELFTAICTLIVGWHFGVSLQTFAALVLTWCLIASSGIDIGHKLLPDSITLPLLWLGLLLGLGDVFVSLEESVIGAAAGYLSLWSVFVLFKLATGKEGMGHGDFKLLAMLGAWTGWKMLLVIILTSSLVGAIVGISMILLKQTERGTQIPFGPYLAAAGWIALLWGESLLDFYFGLFGL